MPEFTSTFLFADPSFISGMAHIFDFEGSLTVYNYSKDRPQADKNALYVDWLAIGKALSDAMATEMTREQALEEK